MRVRAYLDIWPGWKPEFAAIYTGLCIPEKMAGTTRLAFDIEVPDRLVTQEDETVETTPVEVDP